MKTDSIGRTLSEDIAGTRPRVLLAPWLDVLLRTVAALLGGYALAATATAFLALALPMARSQAVLTGMLTGIVLYACAALWAFATRSALRAWLGIGLPAAALALGAYLLRTGPA